MTRAATMPTVWTAKQRRVSRRHTPTRRAPPRPRLPDDGNPALSGPTGDAHYAQPCHVDLDPEVLPPRDQHPARSPSQARRLVAPSGVGRAARLFTGRRTRPCPVRVITVVWARSPWRAPMPPGESQDRRPRAAPSEPLRSGCWTPRSPCSPCSASSPCSSPVASRLGNPRTMPRSRRSARPRRRRRAGHGDRPHMRWRAEFVRFSGGEAVRQGRDIRRARARSLCPRRGRRRSPWLRPPRRARTPR